MYKTLSAPLVAQIEISAQCPNRCMHCYNFWRQSDGQFKFTNLSLEEINRVMDQVIFYHIFHVVLTGGEPLLNKKAMFRALEKATEGGITVGINSSLATLTSSDVKRLKEFNVSLLLTSLMGHTAKIHDEIAQRQGAFKRTIDGIHLLQEASIPVDVNMVVSQKNKHLLKETASLVKSLGLKHFSSTRAGCPGNCPDFGEFSLSLQDFRTYLNDLYNFGQEGGIAVGVLESYPLCAIREVNRYRAFTGRRCLAGVTTITVAANGDVRPCSHLDINYGNLLKEDLKDIWARMTEWRNGSLLPDICRSCKVLPWCGGGCRMEAKMRNGSLDAPDPYTAPEDAEYVFSKLMAHKKQKTDFQPLVKFRINPAARWREEEFGAVVFLGSRFVCYLNTKGFKLLTSLDPNQVYQIPDLANRFSENGVEEFIRSCIMQDTSWTL